MDPVTALMKYSIGIRELALQTEDWDTIEATSFECLPTNHRIPENAILPIIKLGIGPWGWYQMWASEDVHMSTLLSDEWRNTTWKSWATRMLMLTGQLGLTDTKTFQGFDIELYEEVRVRNMAEKGRLQDLQEGDWANVSNGSLLTEWFYQAWMSSLAPNHNQPTIIMRFANDNVIPCTLPSTYQRKDLTDDEVQHFSTDMDDITVNEANKEYLQTFLLGGPSQPALDRESLQEYFTIGDSAIKITNQMARDPRCFNMPFYLPKQLYANDTLADRMIQVNGFCLTDFEQGDENESVLPISEEEAQRELKRRVNCSLEKIWKDLMLQVLNAEFHWTGDGEAVKWQDRNTVIMVGEWRKKLLAHKRKRSKRVNGSRTLDTTGH